MAAGYRGKDMTVGSPTRLILFFSIPLLIGNIFQQLYNMVDTIIVGRFLGVSALAAVGSTGSLSFLVLGFVMGITSGFSVLAAQRFGAGDERGLRHFVAMSVYLGMIISAILTVLTICLTRPMLTLMNTPEDILDSAAVYIIIIFAGILPSMFYNLLAGVLRALGDSKTPLYFLIISSVLNIVLDLFFIVTLHAGVAGAAYATVLSQAVSAVLCLLYIRKRFPILRFQREELTYSHRSAFQLMKVGIPMALQFSITAIGTMILQSAINSFGSTVVGAYTAACKAEQLATQPAVTFGATMASYTGQNLGAGRMDRIRRGVNSCIVISCIFSVLGALLVIFGGGMLVSLFITGDQPKVMAYAREYLNTIAVFFVPLGLIFIYRNTLQGMGDGFMPMMAGVAELVMRAFVAFYLAGHLGYLGICLAGPIAWIGADIPLMLTYYIRMHRIKKRDYDGYGHYEKDYAGRS